MQPAFNGTTGTSMLAGIAETAIPNEQASVVIEKSTTTTTTTLDLWKRRLITYEDPLSFHKLASIGSWLAFGPPWARWLWVWYGWTQSTCV